MAAALPRPLTAPARVAPARRFGVARVPSSQHQIHLDFLPAGRRRRLRLFPGRASVPVRLPGGLDFASRRAFGLRGLRLHTSRQRVVRCPSDPFELRCPLAGHGFELLPQPYGIVRDQFGPVAGAAEVAAENRVGV